MSVERQIRILLRAWPLRDRSERADEIVGTTLDLLPDGATRLPFLLTLNLIVGGMQARWRIRIPVWIWARRTGRAVLVTGMAVVAVVVALVIFLFITLRFFPHDVLSSSSCSFSPPAHSCSPPGKPWDEIWPPRIGGFLGVAAVAVLLKLRRRRRSNRLYEGQPQR
jgi:hypothetical protein